MKVNLGNYKKNGSTRTKSVKIDKWDTWSLDYSLALIIHPALVEFRKNLHGYPSGLTMKRWEKILDKMIWAFANIVDEDAEDQFYSGEHDLVWTPVDKNHKETTKDKAAFFRMDRGPKDTFKIDMKGLKKHNKKIQEGLDLFGKYYRNLWD